MKHFIKNDLEHQVALAFDTAHDVLTGYVSLFGYFVQKKNDAGFEGVSVENFLHVYSRLEYGEYRCMQIRFAQRYFNELFEVADIVCQLLEWRYDNDIF